MPPIPIAPPPSAIEMTDLDLTGDLTVVPPRRPLVGSIRPPGSKSITNRYLLLASLASGTSHLTGALKSDDTVYMAQALRALGVQIDEPDATSFVVTGTDRLRKPAAPLFLGNAGTATRFLTAACALVDGRVIVDGDAHMRQRPIRPLLDALAALGVTAFAPTGCPPVEVQGTGRIKAGRVEIDAGLSSQYVSAMLMIAPLADGPVEIALKGTDMGARGYVDLTLAAMAHFGAKTQTARAHGWTLTPGAYRAKDAEIEPDASAATYHWAAQALTGGSIDLGRPADAFTQPDAKAAALIAGFPDLPAIIDGAQMQDAVPTLAVLAAFCPKPVRFVGIANLRVKECDRIRALATELNRIHPGLAEEIGDDLVINGDPGLIGQSRPTRIETYADHRIAMSFTLAGLMIDGISLANPGCVAKTYPDYFRDLGRLGVQFMDAP